jgi:hypothetical protein
MTSSRSIQATPRSSSTMRARTRLKRSRISRCCRRELSRPMSSASIATRRQASRFSIWRHLAVCKAAYSISRRRAVGRTHACDRSAQCPLRPWHDRLRHGRRTPSLEPSAGIRFAALHNGLERIAARLKRNPTASKDPSNLPCCLRRLIAALRSRAWFKRPPYWTSAIQTRGHQSIFGIESA